MTALSVSAGVIIRPAADGDFEWVSDLMERALSPFYGGDHRAHARRIFDTHIQGGVDYVGHFSAAQHMFIAEVGSTPVGIIHVVEKKQETVKISPLIVRTIPMRKSTVRRRRCASTPEIDDATTWFAPVATAMGGGMPMKNRSGVIRKPPPTPNIPDMKPTIPPSPRRTKALTETSAMGR